MLADAGGGQAQWEKYVHHRISGDLCLCRALPEGGAFFL